MRIRARFTPASRPVCCSRSRCQQTPRLTPPPLPPPRPRLPAPAPPRRPQDDYRFGLLWEWNLYEAMLYSPYVAARLQTWTGARLPLPALAAAASLPQGSKSRLDSQGQARVGRRGARRAATHPPASLRLRVPRPCLRCARRAEKGRNMLELLLAKLGIPLEEAQRSFAGEGCECAPGGRRQRDTSWQGDCGACCAPGAWRRVRDWLPPLLACHCTQPPAPAPRLPAFAQTLHHADDMAPRYRASLQEKLEAHAPAFRMGDVTLKSFQLQAGA